jgi:anti-sigma B factor antagonist
VRAFAVKQQDVAKGQREISVSGELDLAVADQLSDAIEAVPSGYSSVIIGLADCEFLDSMGIAVIVRAHQRLQAEGRRLVVCCAADQAERILKVTGLTENGLVFETLDEALAAG